MVQKDYAGVRQDYRCSGMCVPADELKTAKQQVHIPNTTIYLVPLASNQAVTSNSRV